MKDYNEYTPEDIEDLARECERLAERVAELSEASDELLNISERFHAMMVIILAGSGYEDEELHHHNQETLENIGGVLRDLRRALATPQKESLDTRLPF